MIRVGYPESAVPEHLLCFPQNVQMIALPRELEQPVEIDVWIPDEIGARAKKIWPMLRGVKLVLSQTAGTEWIPETVGPNVTICNARGAHNISTAEWTISSILTMLKYFPFYGEVQKSATWKRRFEASEIYSSITRDSRRIYPPVLLEELTGKTVMLVGHGAIGKEIERMLEPFRNRILRVARSARQEPLVHAVSELDGLLPEADVVVMILPLTAESHHLMNADRMAKMKQGALLVNVARGPVVDTDALVDALNSGHIRAALDVTDPEPLPAEHPLWKCPNLLLTPHVAGSCPHAGERALATAAEELQRYINGEPLQNVVQAAK